MKKKFAMLAAVCAVTMSAVAHNPESATCHHNGCNHQECADTTTCHNGKNTRTLAESRQFEGIELTETQKQQLNALTPCNHREALNADNRANKKEMLKSFRIKARENRAEYISKVKSILTSEQYTRFLENNYVNSIGRHAYKSHAGHRKLEKKLYKKADKDFDKNRKRMNKDKKD